MRGLASAWCALAMHGISVEPREERGVFVKRRACGS
jgi:hypothetical protein